MQVPFHSRVYLTVTRDTSYFSPAVPPCLYSLCYFFTLGTLVVKLEHMRHFDNEGGRDEDDTIRTGEDETGQDSEHHHQEDNGSW